MKSAAQSAALESIVRNFHELYYNDFEQTWEQTYWLGVKVLKCPMDLWIYQELLHKVAPDMVIETGTAHGGSALFIASMMDLIGHGEVVSIDIAGKEHFPDRPVHPRISYVHESSTHPGVVRDIKEAIRPLETVMVILDSDHRKDHVLQELNIYGSMVSENSYMIVEDTNVNGHPILPEHGPGPMEALNEWLPRRPEFEVDVACEKFHMTFNPMGFLRRIS